MKFIHSEVPELSEEILPRSTQEENEVPLQDITIESVKELKSIPIYSEEELIQHPSFELKKLTSNQRKIIKLTRLLVKDIIKNHPNAFDFSIDIIPNLIGKIFTYQTNEPFIDIGTKPTLDEARILAKKQN